MLRLMILAVLWPLGWFQDGGDHESLKDDSEEMSGLWEDHRGGFGMVTMRAEMMQKKCERGQQGCKRSERTTQDC